MTKPAIKKTTAATRRNNLKVIKSEAVGIRLLTPYRDNPNIRDDLEQHKQSLQRNGQFRGIIANLGTQASVQGEILAGNHTYLAAKELGWTRIRVDWVDVTDEQAAAIVAAELGIMRGVEVDDKALQRLLSGLDELTGTGFSDAELAALTEQLGASAEQLTREAEQEQRQMERAEEERRRLEIERDSFDAVPLGEEQGSILDEPGQREPEQDDSVNFDEEGEYIGPGEQQDISEKPEELPGVIDLKDPYDMDFGKGIGYWGIPALRQDRFATFDMLPEKLDVWIGSLSRKSEKNQDPDQWWFYPWGADSTTGMNDVSHCIPCFYAEDQNFENWWYYASRYVKKLLNSKIKMIVGPDFSTYSNAPRIESFWQLYRSRYLSRYFQEAGIPLIPCVEWLYGDMDYLDKYVLGTLPKKLPMISMQLQTIHPDTMPGGVEGFKGELQHIFDKLQPEGALIYASRLGHTLLDGVDTGDTQLRVLGTRLEVIEELTGGEKRRQRRRTI